MHIVLTNENIHLLMNPPGRRKSDAEIEDEVNRILAQGAHVREMFARTSDENGPPSTVEGTLAASRVLLPHFLKVVKNIRY
jgi:hypothetical protein